MNFAIYVALMLILFIFEFISLKFELESLNCAVITKYRKHESIFVKTKSCYKNMKKGMKSSFQTRTNPRHLFLFPSFLFSFSFSFFSPFFPPSSFPDLPPSFLDFGVDRPLFGQPSTPSTLLVVAQLFGVQTAPKDCARQHQMVASLARSVRSVGPWPVRPLEQPFLHLPPLPQVEFASVAPLHMSGATKQLRRGQSTPRSAPPLVARLVAAFASQTQLGSSQPWPNNAGSNPDLAYMWVV